MRALVQAVDNYCAAQLLFIPNNQLVTSETQSTTGRNDLDSKEMNIRVEKLRAREGGKCITFPKALMFLKTENLKQNSFQSFVSKYVTVP